MDRRLKERLIGAAILVALIVLIAPELLSGPERASQAPSVPPLIEGPAGPTEPIRNVTIDLAHGSATGTSTTDSASTDLASTGSAASAAATQAEPPASAASAARPRAPVEISTLHAAPQTPPQPQAQPQLPPQPQPEPRPPPRTQPISPPPTVAASPAKPVMAPIAHDATRHGWTVQLGSFANRGNADALAAQVRAQGNAPVVSATGSGAAARYRVRLGPYADRSAAESSAARLKSQGHAASVVPPSP